MYSEISGGFLSKGDLLSLLVFVMFFSYMIYEIDCDEIHFRKYGSPRGWSESIFCYRIRLFFVCFFVLLVLVDVLLDTVRAITEYSFVVISAYSGACVPPPPGTSKDGELWKKALAWLNRKSKGKLTPEPRWCGPWNNSKGSFQLAFVMFESGFFDRATVYR